MPLFKPPADPGRRLFYLPDSSVHPALLGNGDQERQKGYFGVLDSE
jgi:hypothetical protein